MDPEPADTKANSLLEHDFCPKKRDSLTHSLTDSQTLLDQVKFLSNERKERCAQTSPSPKANIFGRFFTVHREILSRAEMLKYVTIDLETEAECQNEF